MSDLDDPDCARVEQWLAGRIEDLGWSIDSMSDRETAAAILNFPGLTVDRVPLFEWPGGHVDNNPYRVTQPPTHTQLVIRLPIERLGEDPACRGCGKSWSHDPSCPVFRDVTVGQPPLPDLSAVDLDANPWDGRESPETYAGYPPSYADDDPEFPGGPTAGGLPVPEL